MQIDLKSLIIGLLLGVIVLMALGANGSGGANNWGVAVSADGKALVKNGKSHAMIVDINTGKAIQVLFKRPEADSPHYPNSKNGYELNLF
ncbi:MAG: hypothetical protein ACYSSI_08135 [Planctomycetota bacterium]